ncbi:MAG: hypothetical protein ACKVT0_14225 [Planctomycetaceae bacterium]
MPPEHRVAIAILFSLPGWFLIYLSVRATIAYYKEFLQVNVDQITQEKLMGREVILLDDVVQAKWKLSLDVGIILKTPRQRLAIDFALYSRDEILWLIRFFRYRIRPEIQSGWNSFCHRFALHLIEPYGNDHREPDPDEIVLNSRRRIDVIFLFFGVISTAGGVWASRITGKFEAIHISIGIFAIWLGFRFMTPHQTIYRKPEPILREPAVKRPFAFVVGGFISLCIMVFLFDPDRPGNEWGSIQASLMILATGITICALFWFAIRADRVHKQRRLDGSAESVQRWNELEFQSAGLDNDDDHESV